MGPAVALLVSFPLLVLRLDPPWRSLSAKINIATLWLDSVTLSHGRAMPQDFCCYCCCYHHCRCHYRIHCHYQPGRPLPPNLPPPLPPPAVSHLLLLRGDDIERDDGANPDTIERGDDDYRAAAKLD